MRNFIIIIMFIEYSSYICLENLRVSSHIIKGKSCLLRPTDVS